MTTPGTDETKVAVVTGMGPGLGGALCRALCGRGYTVAGLARTTAFGERLATEIAVDGGSFRVIACDIGDDDAVTRAMESVGAELGPPSVLIHNASGFLMKPFAETTPQEFEALWRVTCLGAVHCARAVAPAMATAGNGAILFTGATASLRGGKNFAAFAAAKFALRAVAQSLAREYGPRGVHVAHVVVDGMILTPRTRDNYGADPDQSLDPAAMAEAYMRLIEQDRSAWSHEIDLRPWTETF